MREIINEMGHWSFDNGGYLSKHDAMYLNCTNSGMILAHNDVFEGMLQSLFASRGLNVLKFKSCKYAVVFHNFMHVQEMSTCYLGNEDCHFQYQIFRINMTTLFNYEVPPVISLWMPCILPCIKCNISLLSISLYLVSHSELSLTFWYHCSRLEWLDRASNRPIPLPCRLLWLLEPCDGMAYLIAPESPPLDMSLVNNLGLRKMIMVNHRHFIRAWYWSLVIETFAFKSIFP